MIRAGVLYKRYTHRAGTRKPSAFIASGPPDDSGRTPGWVPVGHGAADQWHREGLLNYLKHYRSMLDGTYELVGPKIQGNPESYAYHTLVRHGAIKLENVPTDYNGLKDWLTQHHHWEGVVWHTPDGRMAKVKCRDYGITRLPVAQATTG